ncbi:MAG: DMT family transporter [Gammaproteobacteria bacterium]
MQGKHNAHHNPAMGIFFMLLATVLFSASDALGKLLTGIYPVVQVTWIRSVLGLLFIGSYAITTKRTGQLITGKHGWHLLRSLLSTLLLLGIFFSLKHIPLAEVVSIAFSTPFIVALLSPAFVHEKVSMQSWIAIATGFTGILIIVRPTPDHFHIAHLVMLGFATSAALLILTARRLALTESAVSLNFYLYPVTIIITSFWAHAVWVMPTITDWLLFVCLGFFATSALGCIIQAMRYARPAVVAPIDYVRIIWTIIVGYLFWHEIPDPVTWIGIAIIVISGIYIVSHGRTVPEVGVDQTPLDDEGIAVIASSGNNLSGTDD